MPASKVIARPRAILFDHDGVLVESEPLHANAWGHLLVELGLPHSAEDIRSLVGRTAPQIMTWHLDRYRPGWTKAEYDLDALAQRKNDIYLEAVKTRLTLYPGVREGLEWIRANGIRTAIVSNAKRRELLAAHERLGTMKLFDEIVSRDDAGSAKPDPGPYLFAAAALGIEPADCVAVEDSPPGIESALVARIPAAAVLTNFSREAMEAPVPGRPDLRPDWIGGSMTEFFDWIRGLSLVQAP